MRSFLKRMNWPKACLVREPYINVMSAIKYLSRLKVYIYIFL